MKSKPFDVGDNVWVFCGGYLRSAKITGIIPEVDGIRFDDGRTNDVCGSFSAYKLPRDKVDLFYDMETHIDYLEEKLRYINEQYPEQEDAMKKSNYERMIGELKNVFDPQVYDMDDNGSTLYFSVSIDSDDEGEGILRDINAVLKKYGQSAEWGGSGDTDEDGDTTHDAICHVSFDAQ